MRICEHAYLASKKLAKFISAKVYRPWSNSDSGHFVANSVGWCKATLVMTDSNPDELTAEVVVEQLKTIAQSGDVEIPWADLQRALKSRLDVVLESYKERSDFKEEPSVEDSYNEISELIASFEEPPFTIQRICELLHSPFKYYDDISTFLRGLEKNLRVISSND